MDSRTAEELIADYVLHAHKLCEQFAIKNSDEEWYALTQMQMEKYDVR